MCSLVFCVFQNVEALHKLKGENVNPFNSLNTLIIKRYTIYIYKITYSQKISFPRLPCTHLKTIFENVNQFIKFCQHPQSTSGLFPTSYSALSDTVLSNCQVILTTQLLFYYSEGSVCI